MTLVAGELDLRQVAAVSQLIDHNYNQLLIKLC